MSRAAQPPTTARVCRAISSSSFVGTTSTATGEHPSRYDGVSPAPRCARRRADAEPSSPASDRRAHDRRVLADARGEHDRVGAAERREVRAEVRADPVRVDVERERAPRRRPPRPPSTTSRMSPRAAEPEQAAAAVEQRRRARRSVHARHAVQVEEHGGVDVARARAHHEALERRHPHRGVDRAPAVDRRTPTRRCRGAARSSRSSSTGRPSSSAARARHVAVRGAVEPVAPHAVLRRELGVDRVGVAPRAAGSGGTRCRRRRRAARRGRPRARPGCRPGWPGCAAARAPTSSLDSPPRPRR